MWIERLMAGISHQHVLSYNPQNDYFKLLVYIALKEEKDSKTFVSGSFSIYGKLYFSLQCFFYICIDSSVFNRS